MHGPGFMPWLDSQLSDYLASSFSSVKWGKDSSLQFNSRVKINVDKAPGTGSQSEAMGLPGGAMDGSLPASAGDTGSIPGPGGSTCRRATELVCHNC